MRTIEQSEPSAKGSLALRVIAIAKAGVAGMSFAIATTDEAEVAVRKDAMAQGLLAGPPMWIQPDPTIWQLLDHLKSRGD